MDIAELCNKADVKEIYISGITCRPGCQNKIDSINEMLKSNATIADYIFIDNKDIKQDKHLWKDRVHLNNDGLIILADNFINTINVTN